MASVQSQKASISVDSTGLAASFHLSRFQVEQLIDALRKVVNDLAAREVGAVISA